MKALIVDDDKQNRYMLRALLQGNGYTVDEAQHGEEALLKARQSPPEVVISDLLMPVMDGYTLLRHWKRDDRLKRIPFVVYTATYTRPEDEQLASDLGADAFILKPAESVPFMAQIRAVLEDRHSDAPPTPRAPQHSEHALLTTYAEVIGHKLDDKIQKLEQANQALREDMVRRRQAERELRENEERLRLALAAAKQGLFDLDVQTGETIVTPEYACVLGYDPGQFRESEAGWRERIHPDDRESVYRAYEECIAGRREGYRVEYRQRTKSGDWKWILTQGKVVAHDGRGRPLRLLGTHADITERKQAELALAESETRYRVLVENAGEAICVAQDGWLKYVNPKGERTIGYSRQELTSRPFAEFLHPEDRARVLEYHAQRLRGKELPTTHVCRVIHRSGQTRFVELTVAAIEWDHKPATVSFLADITERRQAFEALRESERRFQSLAKTSPVGVFRTDPNGQTTYVNPRWCEIAGLTSDEALGIGWLRGVHPDDREAIVRGWARASGSEEVSETDYRFLRPDGTTRWVLGRAVPERNDSGAITGYVGTITDITDHKVAERRIADALNFNRAIIDSSPIGIITYQATGEAVTANQAFAQIIGATLEQALAQNFHQLASWKRSGLYGAATTALATQTEQEIEVRHESAFGRERSLACRLIPFSFAERQHLLLLAMDVTEKKLTEARLLRAQRVESIGSLASGLAHDLNNILAPTLICAPLLENESRPEIRRHLAHIIDSSTQRAVNVVRQLLGFARGREENRSVLQLRHLVRDMAKLARETFPRNIQVEDECARDLWPLMGDATQLHQVILNLCVNARDAMPGGGRLTLQTENIILDEHYAAMHKEARPGPFVRLQVADTGTGIPDEVREHIFESFFTTKDEGQGTGLGLTTAHGIIRDHKGFITFTSLPGKGTTFEVYLPAVLEAEPRAETTESIEAIHRGQGELILVVDDEPAICDATRRTLESYGYRALCASDGIEALTVFSAHQPEVRAIVTDFMMPLKDGAMLCRTLQALSPQTPIIVSSGGLFGEPGLAALRAFHELGIRHILQKPHTAAALLRALEDALRPPVAPAEAEASSGVGDQAPFPPG